MIYAIILIVLGLIAIIFNKRPITKKAAIAKAWLAPLFIIWGTVGIVILSTIRYSVIYENATYWYFLILGSSIEILIAIFFIYRYIKLKKNPLPDDRLFLLQSILGIAAILVGVATILVK
ncbi:hypothetical protein [Dysgonomonas sp. ZJ709]|uniref:hypothetical protein n=1 Tax=Dysgonomonas sp. ZJ709 TaxID=2709797 RepID=UPI0013EB720E|nr:hypothetical protein [Dysgonomonas sp. ZJ709]